jgi:hypothetical protein
VNLHGRHAFTKRPQPIDPAERVQQLEQHPIMPEDPAPYCTFSRGHTKPPSQTCWTAPSGTWGRGPVRPWLNPEKGMAHVRRPWSACCERPTWPDYLRPFATIALCAEALMTDETRPSRQARRRDGVPQYLRL